MQRFSSWRVKSPYKAQRLTSLKFGIIGDGWLILGGDVGEMTNGPTMTFMFICNNGFTWNICLCQQLPGWGKKRKKRKKEIHILSSSTALDEMRKYTTTLH